MALALAIWDGFQSGHDVITWQTSTHYWSFVRRVPWPLKHSLKKRPHSAELGSVFFVKDLTCAGELRRHDVLMMTSSNGNIFRVTGPLCGEFTGPGEFPTQRPVTRSFNVFFDLRLNKPLSKQSWGWWFETQSPSLWRHCNELFQIVINHWSSDRLLPVCRWRNLLRSPIYPFSTFLKLLSW